MCSPDLLPAKEWWCTVTCWRASGPARWRSVVWLAPLWNARLGYINDLGHQGGNL